MFSSKLRFGLWLVAITLLSDVHLSYAQQTTENRFRISGIILEVNDETSTRQPSAESQARRGGQREGQGSGMNRLPGVPMPGVNVSLLSSADSSLVTGTATNEMGLFALERVSNGEYLLAATFVGFTTQLIPVQVSGSDITRLVIRMTEGPQMLDELQISALTPRVEIRGDTTAFNADAFQVNPDASAEDLVRRMPGFVVQDGQLQAQGEAVRRVLLDGEEFFGDDATIALRNLPADIVGSIELFDRRSDQARFTGFDDGNEERTINIVTRTGRLNGQFGRGTLSAGNDERYMASGNVNYFSGPRRISVLGMSNNVNQQNFTGADLEGVAAASQNQGGGGGRRWGGNPATRNFMTGSQSGINTTHSLGANYIDRIGKFRINSSYFFTAGDNTTNQTTNRQFISEVESGQTYNDRLLSERSSLNHRFNARVEYNMNDRNSFVFTPSANLFRANSEQFQDGVTLLNGSNLNSLLNAQESEDLAFNSNSSLLWRRSFEQRGRTLSVNQRNNISNRTGDVIQNTTSTFFGDNTELATAIQRVTDQSTEAETRSFSTSTDIQFTEPLRDNVQVLVRFRPSYDETDSERLIFDLNPSGPAGPILNTNLTNQFISKTWAHQAGTGLRVRRERFNINADLNYEYTLLKGDQTLPTGTEIRNVYNNLVGSMNIRYQFSRTANLNINYRTNTQNPSISQLQEVIDNSNPLVLRGGNPDLDQQYAQTISARYRTANIDAGTSWFGVIAYTLTNNTIGNTTLIATSDTLLAPGVILGPGARFTRPENIGASHRIRSFFNHSRAVPLIQSNANFIWRSNLCTTTHRK
ncbi:MAG: outer membrane beta-barrel protein [Bacteroidetes bacterium]|nr:outer membrane beta-barrel protein [Bacteroidota bacterium]